MRYLHVDFRRFLRCLNKPERFIEVNARAVEPMLCPNNEPCCLHLLSGGLADLVRSAKHPRENVHTVREYDDALCTHLPERPRECLFVESVDIGHR